LDTLPSLRAVFCAVAQLSCLLLITCSRLHWHAKYMCAFYYHYTTNQ